MTAIDISYAQTTNMDFVAMRPVVDTVIMKAGGSNSGRYVDSKYRYFEPRARAAGHRIGHYWFNGTGDPVVDADFFVNNLSGYNPNDLLALDVESEGSMPYASPAWALAFVNRVKQRTGRNCDVYMSSSVTRAQNWQSLVDAGSKLWVAQYGSNSGTPEGKPNIGYWPTYKLWQYSSNGSVPGYAGRVDVNVVNESQWSSGGVTPIKKKKKKTMYISFDTNQTGYLHTDNGSYAFGPDIEGVSGADQLDLFRRIIRSDQDAEIPVRFNSVQERIINTILNSLKPTAPSFTPAQLAAITAGINAGLKPGATEEEVQAIVNGAVTKISGLHYGAL